MGRHKSVLIALAAVAATLVAGEGCTVNNPEVPAIMGPTELGLSIQLTATPDVLPLDGASQALIRIFARNERGEPIRNLRLRLAIVTNFRNCQRIDDRLVCATLFEDFGQLSARTITTGSDGRAAVTYTVPLGSVNPAGSVDSFIPVSSIEIWVTPEGTDFGSAIRRNVMIRLVPPGQVIPPANFRADFTFSPTSPSEFDEVLFLAAPYDPFGLVTQYYWDFGDGSTGEGARVSHTYSRAGRYFVTLTVADNYGRSSSIIDVVEVAAGPTPTALISFSPSSPRTNQTVFFDGSRSTPSPGRQIVSYSWTFGDGSTASGVSATHKYTAAATYVVTLTVTDDKGAKGTATQSVIVVTSAPTALFTYSPTQIGVNTHVFFNGSGSTATSGRYLVDWDWNFGDGTGANGELVTKVFTQAGTYVVTLIVTDNLGEIGRTTQTVTVGATGTGPTASFTISPSPAAPGASVTFDASSSTAPGGATIVAYIWNFGDSTAQTETTSPLVSHTYAAPGDYTITLTVRDSVSRTATTTETLTVEVP